MLAQPMARKSERGAFQVMQHANGGQRVPEMLKSKYASRCHCPPRLGWCSRGQLVGEAGCNAGCIRGGWCRRATGECCLKGRVARFLNAAPYGIDRARGAVALSLLLAPSYVGG